MMADMHVIDGAGKGAWRVVMHFDTPDIDNAVAVNYRTAIKNSGLVDSTSPSVLPDGDGTGGSISAAEKTDLVNGVKFEHVANLTLDGSGTTDSTRVAVLRAAYARLESDTVEKVKERLKFFGHNETKV